MPPETATAARPTRAELVAAFGRDYLSVQSLLGFCRIPPATLYEFRALPLLEDWGAEGHVLLPYLAVDVRLAVEQSLYVWDGNQVLLRAGRLATAAGLTMYRALGRTCEPSGVPWKKLGVDPPFQRQVYDAAFMSSDTKSSELARHAVLGGGILPAAAGSAPRGCGGAQGTSSSPRAVHKPLTS